MALSGQPFPLALAVRERCLPASACDGLSRAALQGWQQLSAHVWVSAGPRGLAEVSLRRRARGETPPVP